MNTRDLHSITCGDLSARDRKIVVDSDPMVLVTAVGFKDRDVVRIGGEVANL